MINVADCINGITECTIRVLVCMFSSLDHALSVPKMVRVPDCANRIMEPAAFVPDPAKCEPSFTVYLLACTVSVQKRAIGLSLFWARTIQRVHYVLACGTTVRTDHLGLFKINNNDHFGRQSNS